MNHLSPSSSSAYSSKEKILFLLSLFLSLPRLQYMFFSPPDDPLAIRASNSQNFSLSSNACCPNACPPLLFFSFSHLYITPQDLNLFPKRKILLFPFFFSSFFKSSNQKQSSQFQIPLQNLPRRVPPSLNSNGKFPCKNMKFLKLNN